MSLHAHVAQAAEHFLGKEEVTGSIPVVGFHVDIRCASRRTLDETVRVRELIEIEVKKAKCET